MPKARSRRRRGKYIRGKVDESLTLGALAAGGLVAGDFDETVNERALVSSVVCTYSLMDFTSGEGPVTVGICHGDYTAAEILEWIDNAGSWNEGSKVEQEIAKRLIRTIGTFAIAEVLNDGKPIKTKLNWILNQGESLRLWARNENDDPMTTGTELLLNGHANVWPR